MLNILNELVSLAKNLGINLEEIWRYLGSPWGVSIISLLTISLSLAKFLRVDIHEVAIYFLRLFSFSFRRLRGSSTVLLFTDADESGDIGATIAERLKKRLRADLSKNVKVISLTNGDQFLHNPIFPFLVEAVVIIITDVTTLSNDKIRRSYIQKKLQEFVRFGGVAILSHDTLYRRSKNHIFQRLAGCTITEFYSCSEPVGYVKVSDGVRKTSNIDLYNSLPPTVSLWDNEVVFGNWVPGVEFLYVWDRYPHIPVVTRRQVGRGAVFWCNTGDKNNGGPPPALVEPHGPLVPLLSKMISVGRD